MFIRHWKPINAAAVLMAVALAGCVTGGDALDDEAAKAKGGSLAIDESAAWSPYGVPPEPDYDFREAFDVVHAHDVRELHTNSHGLELVGWNPLLDDTQTGTFQGGFIEVDVHGDLAVVATLTGMRAFTLVDISDLAAPKVLSTFYSSNDNWDVRISDDGRYVFVGCQGSGLYTFTPVGDCDDYDGIPSNDGNDNGIITVDIIDRANPKALCYTPTKSVHNLETVTTAGGAIIVGNSATELFVMKPDGCLEKTFELNENGGTHDMSLQYHPATGELVAYTGMNSFSVYNIDNPWEPYVLGQMDPNNVTGAQGWHEQSPAPSLYYGDTHLTIGAGENGAGQPGYVTVIDTTDPEAPIARGSWILPVPTPVEGDSTLYNQGGYMFSEHNAAMNQWGQACIGHYHGGVWVIDMSSPGRMTAPVTLGFYLPHERSPTAVTTFHPAALGPMSASPYVWGCAWTDDGTHVVVADMHSGIYILEGSWFEPVGTT